MRLFYLYLCIFLYDVERQVYKTIARKVRYANIMRRCLRWNQRGDTRDTRVIRLLRKRSLNFELVYEMLRCDANVFDTNILLHYAPASLNGIIVLFIPLLLSFSHTIFFSYTNFTSMLTLF